MKNNYLFKNLMHCPAVRILKGRLACRDKKCLFSVTSTSAPVHSTYAAMSASADFNPLASYLAPNSNGISKSLSIIVAVFIKSINSLKASAVKLLRTSSIIKRVIRIGITSIDSATFARSFSQFGYRTTPKAKIYSLLSITSCKFFSPKFFSGFTNFIYYLLFTHSTVRRAGLSHQLTNFFQMHFRFFNILFYHISHLLYKYIIFGRGCQADFTKQCSFDTNETLRPEVSGLRV